MRHTAGIVESLGDTERRRVGRYLLDSQVGHGGMGRVYRAHALGVAGIVKELCIKQIHSKQLGPSATRRFIEEARTSMRLAHSNIVSVFDFGRAGDEYYLAMEWVDGVDLRTFQRENGRALSEATTAWIGAAVARALAYAHEQGTVHRDVKPANVLVSRTGDIKLTDFGVAGLRGDERAGVGGTPGYMAPEQRAGGAPDPRSDLYSLGVLLVELRTGKRPVEANGALEGFSPPFRDLVDGLLSEMPEDRPSAAKDVASILEEFVASVRVANGEVPRDWLAEQIPRVSRAPASESQELPVDASFLRDGDAYEFATMMTADGRSTTRQAPPSNRPGVSRRVLFGSALGVILGAAVVASVFLTPSPTLEPSERNAQASQPAPSGQPVSESGLGDDGPSARSAPLAEAEQPSPSVPRNSTSPAVDTAPSAARRSGRAPRPSSPRLVAPAAEGPGTLNINAVPWAEVELDGRPLGVTPLFGVEVAPGVHQLRLINPELEVEQRRNVRIAGGETQDIVVPLQ